MIQVKVRRREDCSENAYSLGHFNTGEIPILIDLIESHGVYGSDNEGRVVYENEPYMGSQFVIEGGGAYFEIITE